MRDHTRDDKAKEGHRRPRRKKHKQKEDVRAFPIAILDLSFERGGEILKTRTTPETVSIVGRRRTSLLNISPVLVSPVRYTELTP